MISILSIFIVIISLFFILLFLKAVTKKNFCVICSSFAITWVGLLFMLLNGMFNNKVLLGIFMGQTSVGLYYFLEIKLKEKFHIFRLPFLLSLTLLIYSILDFSSEIIPALNITLASWVFFISIFAYRKSPGAKKLAKKIIECCKGW